MSKLDKVIREITPDMVFETHNVLFPNYDSHDLEQFSPPMEEALTNYVRILIGRIRDRTLDDIPGDDLEGYVYEALRVHFVCGLVIGMKEGKGK